MSLPVGHLTRNPLPAGILGALSLSGYQLLAEVAGVGAGRLGTQVFLIVADDREEPTLDVGLGEPSEPGSIVGQPIPIGTGMGTGTGTAPAADGATPVTPALDAGTQLSLHQPRLRGEQDVLAYKQLAAQLGFLRLSGYRLALERAGLRSRIGVLDPATGAILLTIPEKHPGRLFGGDTSVHALLAATRRLPAAGPPPNLQDPEILHQMLLSMALRDESLGGAEAAELAERAVELVRSDRSLDPARALEAAKRSSG